MKAFFDSGAKEKVKGAIQAIESETSAEIVVTVRDRSAVYRDADFIVGFVFALLVLAGLTYAPMEFNAMLFPAEVLVVFLVFAVGSAHIWFLKGLVVPAARRRAEVARAAESHFYQAQISRTTGRTGILVFVSGFERAVHFVPDLGVPVKKLGPAIDAARAELETALGNGDVDAFVARLKALGPVLGKELPRSADDVNELPDEVS